MVKRVWYLFPREFIILALQSLLRPPASSLLQFWFGTLVGFSPSPWTLFGKRNKWLELQTFVCKMLEFHPITPRCYGNQSRRFRVGCECLAYTGLSGIRKSYLQIRMIAYNEYNAESITRFCFADTYIYYADMIIWQCDIRIMSNSVCYTVCRNPMSCRSYNTYIQRRI